jgi:hypothetical protein
MRNKRLDQQQKKPPGGGFFVAPFDSAQGAAVLLRERVTIR